MKAEFGSRLRTLLNLTGLSSRQFAQRYPAYKDSTVRKYLLGTNLPAWDFLHALLTEVTRRTDDPAGPQRRTELFTAYRQILVDIGADVHGSDQNSLLLRLHDGEQALGELTRDIELLHEGADQVRERLEEERRTADDSDAIRDLERQSAELTGRREALASRRADLAGDLERCRMLLQLMEQTPGTGPALGAGTGEHTSGGPELRRTSRPWFVAGVTAAGVLALAAAAFGGVLYQGSHDSSDRSPQAGPPATATSPTPTPSPAPTPSLTASPSPSAPSSTPSSSSPKPDDAPQPTRHKIDLPAGYAIDLSYVKPTMNEEYGDFYYYTAFGSRVGTMMKRPLVLLDERVKGSLQKCLTDTRFSSGGIDLGLLSKGSQICAITDEGHVALVTIRTMPSDASSDYLGLDITLWRFAAAPDIEEE